MTTLKCPNCGSENVSRYKGYNGLVCNHCDHMGGAQDFGAKCTCAQPHYTPLWWCDVHGEVIVPMD